MGQAAALLESATQAVEVADSRAILDPAAVRLDFGDAVRDLLAGLLARPG